MFRRAIFSVSAFPPSLWFIHTVFATTLPYTQTSLTLRNGDFLQNASSSFDYRLQSWQQFMGHVHR